MEDGPGGPNLAVQLRQMMLDMGYAEDAARSALQRCGSVDEAIDLIASEDVQDPRVVAPDGIGEPVLQLLCRSLTSSRDLSACRSLSATSRGGGTHCTFQQEEKHRQFWQRLDQGSRNM